MRYIRCGGGAACGRRRANVRYSGIGTGDHTIFGTGTLLLERLCLPCGWVPTSQRPIPVCIGRSRGRGRTTDAAVG